jgi:hypothetical protein
VGGNERLARRSAVPDRSEGGLAELAKGQHHATILGAAILEPPELVFDAGFGACSSSGSRAT